MLRLRLFTTIAALTLTTAAANGQAPAPVLDSVKVVDITGTPADDLVKVLHTQIEAAKAAGRTPVVELGAVWCGPCKHIAASLGDSRMQDAFAGTYIIRLDIDEWKGKLESLGFKSDGIPAFFPIGDDGKALGPVITGAAWEEDIPENMAPPLKKFFSENLRKKTAEKKA